MKRILNKTKELPEFLRKQVLDFMDFLSRKYKSRMISNQVFLLDGRTDCQI
jgi:hypothetical protein